MNIEETAKRTIAIADAITAAALALEDENWQGVEAHCREAARQARVIALIAKKEKP